MTPKSYEISNILVALKTFHLDDIYHREWYYGPGDEFIIMDIHFYNEK